MRMLSKLLAGTAGALALTALVAGPAMADPPSGTTPRASDVVGVGSDTTQFLVDQLSHDFNAQHATASTKLYSWDAVPQGQTITTKAGGVSNDCTMVRPTGSSAGIAALEANATTNSGTGFCADFARSSRGRASTDPACASGGICFVAMGGDAVTWSSRSAAAGGTNAPASLTLAQLKNIYLCKTRNWSAVGGKSGTIKPFLPQSSSGTRTFFLTALGGGTTAITPGACVSDVNNTLIENEGVAPQLNNVNTIFPYSAGDYIAQVQHSAKCTNGASCGYPNAPQCNPTSKQNLFGCDLHGKLQIRAIGGTAPTTPFPPHVGACGGTTGFTCAVVNSNFSPMFQRVIYNVVRFSGSTTDHIPSYLEPFFGAANASTKGWVCTNAKAKTDLKNYGFRVFPNTAPTHCGSVN
jgi:ABC-type phosphate transport system substrate-binding protein